MNNKPPRRFKKPADYHAYRGLPAPEHPLVSVINLGCTTTTQPGSEPLSLVLDFYSISMKRVTGGKMRYGQQSYDFDNGMMAFMAPGQVFSIEPPPPGHAAPSGYILMVHPDFFWGTPLAQKIKRYEFFGYAVHEALHLSEKEEAIITGLMQSIETEYRSSIDKFSNEVIVAQIELLLTYAERFYQRQFITRKIGSHQMLARFEELLDAHFSDESLAGRGLPTVQAIAGALAVSPNYLGGILKSLTGQSTQQHIHNKLMERAKEKLSTTNLSVSEIAYALGFEHSQSFSKLFKKEAAVTPGAFRQSFN